MRLGANLLAALMVVASCSDDPNGTSAERDDGAGLETDVAAAEDRPEPEALAADQTLNVFSFFRPPSFDPGQQASGTIGGNGLGRQYGEALLRPDAEVTAEAIDVIPAAAESYEVSEDGLVYTFTLRDDGRYNDGEAVEAEDFVFAWRRLIDPRLGAPLGGTFANVVAGGIEAADLGPEAGDAAVDAALDELGLGAVDATTFEVTLAQPAAYFKWIATLHQGAPIRQDVVEQFGSDTWAGEPETLITNGPFQVTEIGQTETTMEANPHYWNRDEVGLDRLVAGYGLDPAPRWALYLNDELDISNGPPPASYAAGLNDPQFEDEIIRFPELSIGWLQFNTTRPPFDNPDVRLAFAQAIDREAYNQIAADTGAPITSLIPEGLPGHDPDVGDVQSFDPDQARATLAASGVDPTLLQGISLITGPAQATNAAFLAEAIEEQLGVSLTIESIGDSATLNSRLAQGDYQARVTFVGHAANYPDPQDFFDVFLSTSRENQTGWSNADYDRLVTEANQILDLDERLALYDEAHQILVEEAPVAFLVQLQRIFWVKPWVRGIERTLVDSAFFPGDLHSTSISIAEH